MRSVVSGDFDKDGSHDLVMLQSSGALSLFLNDGTGAFPFRASYGLKGRSPRSIAAGDFNGDGKLDLAVANSGSGGNNVAILIGDGAGNFGTARRSSRT